MPARRHASRVIVTFAAAFLLGACQAEAAQSPPPVGAAALDAFMSRVEAYARLHQRLEAPFPPIDSTADSLSRLLNRQYLASAIRAARRHAKEGDIFTPDVADMFRTRVAKVTAGLEMAMALDQAGEESWPAAVVNEPFREETSQPVPPLLLEALPPLPGGIEYRIVGTDLVLWDVHADIVIDVLPDAFRPPSYV